MFSASKQHATGSEHSKIWHGMNLLEARNKSPLLSISQKGSENILTPMSIKQVSLQISDLAENWTCQKQITSRHVYELDALTTEHCMINYAYIHQEDMAYKLDMARTTS